MKRPALSSQCTVASALVVAASVSAIAFGAVAPPALGLVSRHERVPLQLIDRFPLNPISGGVAPKTTAPPSVAKNKTSGQPANPPPPQSRPRGGHALGRGSGSSLYWMLLVGSCPLVVLGGWVLGGWLARWRMSRAQVRFPDFGEEALAAKKFHRVRYTGPVRSRRLAASDRGGAEAFHLGVLLEGKGDIAGAEDAYRLAAANGSVAALSNLGVLLHERGQLEAAKHYYRKAFASGDPLAAFNLGVLRAEQHDTAGAESAYRCADSRGHGAAAVNLGVLLEAKGALAPAHAAYSRADERGDPKGAFNLGTLLEEHGDLVAARAAYRRAAERLEARQSEATSTTATSPKALADTLARGEIASAERGYRPRSADGARR